MPRVKRGVTARTSQKDIKLAKGYYSSRSRAYRLAKQAVIRAGQYAYRDRRQCKRQFRALWIVRINAQARVCGISYSRLMSGLKKPIFSWTEKVMAAMAMFDKPGFAVIVEKAKQALAA